MQKECTRYYKYSNYLKEQYGEKIYKLPINLPVTCPNRDGRIGYSGCAFCGANGADFEMLENSLSVKEQLYLNKAFIEKKYKAKKFIAYFQNFCNTYMPLEKFIFYINEALSVEQVIGLAIATRPDCLLDSQLAFLKKAKEVKKTAVTLELGLQTVNYHILKKLNRGHTLGEFINAVMKCKQYDLRVCAHVILNLPNEERDDVIETAKVLSALQIDEVKIHSLFIMEDTKIAKWYKEKQFSLINEEEYIQRVVLFLRFLRKEIVVQRLIGRAPKKGSLFVNWQSSWWKIRDSIENELLKENVYQGDCFKESVWD